MSPTDVRPFTLTIEPLSSVISNRYALPEVAPDDGINVALNVPPAGSLVHDVSALTVRVETWFVR